MVTACLHSGCGSKNLHDPKEKAGLCFIAILFAEMFMSRKSSHLLKHQPILSNTIQCKKQEQNTNVAVWKLTGKHNGDCLRWVVGFAFTHWRSRTRLCYGTPLGPLYTKGLRTGLAQKKRKHFPVNGIGIQESRTQGGWHWIRNQLICPDFFLQTEVWLNMVTGLKFVFLKSELEIWCLRLMVVPDTRRIYCRVCEGGIRKPGWSDLHKRLSSRAFPRVYEAVWSFKVLCN